MIALVAMSSSVCAGGKLKFVGSALRFNDFASFNELVCTGESGANFGEGSVIAGGGVDIGKLDGVLPAAAFFSIYTHTERREREPFKKLHSLY